MKQFADINMKKYREIYEEDSRVKAVISLDAVEHNFREMRKKYCRRDKDDRSHKG